MIYHVTTRRAWETAVSHADGYLPDNFQAEGFIHCSTKAQLLRPANALFRGQQGLVLLCIDPEKVTALVQYEDCYDHGDKFPHIYGPLNFSAVAKVISFPPNPDGFFSLPPEIAP